MGRTGLRLLVDTHTFLWAAEDSPSLSPRARELIADTGTNVLISAVTVLEIAIKSGQGRLDLPEPAEDYIPARIVAFGLEELPVLVNHALRVERLPRIHGDPFDRLLVAQAQVEGVPILTSDANIARYDVETIW